MCNIIHYSRANLTRVLAFWYGVFIIRLPAISSKRLLILMNHSDPEIGKYENKNNSRCDIKHWITALNKISTTPFSCEYHWSWYHNSFCLIYNHGRINVWITEHIKAPRHWPLWGEFTDHSPHKRPVMRKMAPFDDVIMCIQS